MAGARNWLRPVLGAAVACAVLGPIWLRADDDSFSRDVMAVLSRAGCNQGACHGNLNGKGGFKLSLRGQEPLADFRSLVREAGGRRVDVTRPAASLLLLKATGRVAHQGGRRFRDETPEYAVLHDWIARGCPPPRSEESPVAALRVEPAEAVVVEPADAVRLRVTAVDPAGRSRDVTHLAAWETSNLVARVEPDGTLRRLTAGETTVLVRYLDRQVPVRVAFLPDRPLPPPTSYAPAGPLDRLWWERWQSLRVRPAAEADAATLVRRLFLDLLAVLPTADEAREFVADSAVDKWERLIDRVLARPEFADRWALAWSDILRVEEKVLDQKGVELFHGWIREQLQRGIPLDRFVRDLVLAQGSTYQSPPANFYRALRSPAVRGETVGRLFLGVRLQCAQCHNHPFDQWTQDDYYRWAALFSRVDYQIVENQRKDKLDQHEFVGEQIVRILDVGEVTNPRTGRDAVPGFLGADTPEMEPNSDRREPLADWLTRPANERFRRTQVNFVWFHLLGRGLVEPVDDLRPTNPAAHPQVLDWLAAELLRGGFDLRSLIRSIVSSRLYRLAAEPNDTNADDESLFARAIVRRWPAEVLLDAQARVLDLPHEFTGYDKRLRAGQLPGVRRSRDRDRRASDGDRFLTTFGKPPRLLACACERSDETTLKQALLLLGSDDLHERLDSTRGQIERWLHSDMGSAAAVEELYWTALSRGPTAAERQWAAELLAPDATRSETFRDLAWALLNAKEFLFRH